MHHNIVLLAAILATFPLSALADEASMQACAKSLSPAARMIYEASAASLPPSSALRDVVAAQTRKLVMAGRIERAAARPAAEAAGNCLKMAQQ
jgi:hypothetical protein